MNETVQQSRQRHIDKMLALAKVHEENAGRFSQLAVEEKSRARTCRQEAERHQRLQKPGNGTEQARRAHEFMLNRP